MADPLIGRTWKSNDGKTIEAELVQVVGEDVVLLMQGREFKVPINKLSSADQEFIVALQKKKEEFLEIEKGTVWIVAKVINITPDGILVSSAQSHEASNVTADESSMGVTEEAKMRLDKERSSLPDDLKKYLSKGGTMWASKNGLEYIASNWIKSIDDYDQYFSAKGLFKNRYLLEWISKYPPVFTEDVFYINKHDRLKNLVDEDIVLIWAKPTHPYKYTTTQGSQKTVKAFVVAPPEVLDQK